MPVLKTSGKHYIAPSPPPFCAAQPSPKMLTFQAINIAALYGLAIATAASALSLPHDAQKRDPACTGTSQTGYLFEPSSGLYLDRGAEVDNMGGGVFKFLDARLEGWTAQDVGLFLFSPCNDRSLGELISVVSLVFSSSSSIVWTVFPT